MSKQYLFGSLGQKVRESTPEYLRGETLGSQGKAPPEELARAAEPLMAEAECGGDWHRKGSIDKPIISGMDSIYDPYLRERETFFRIETNPSKKISPQPEASPTAFFRGGSAIDDYLRRIKGTEATPQLESLRPTAVLREEDIRPFLREATPVPRDATSDLKRGYIHGLQQFMGAKGIDFASTNIDTMSLDRLLSSPFMWADFVRGVKLQGPNAPYASKYGIIQYLDRGVLSNLTGSLFEHSPAAYSLGFVIAIARDYGVVLAAGQVPSDMHKYQSFMKGLRAEPIVQTTDAKYTFRKTIEDYNLDLTDYGESLADSRTNYLTGLRVWLASNGIDTVKAEQIENPHALKGFKAGLAGEDLPAEYKQSDKMVISQGEDDNLISLLGSLETRYYNYLNLPKIPRTQTPQEEARAQGQLGYTLGQMAREQRNPNSSDHLSRLELQQNVVP